MEFLRALLFTLACGACTPAEVIEKPVMAPVDGPPPGAMSCARWPEEDDLSLPAAAEDVIRWHRAQRAKDELAFRDCKNAVALNRTWAQARGYGRRD
ncbi:MAG TPA: hypothetical protein VN838_16140 [Bradyrhizobium sp.]|nr:hypothetical protein [Bradyrhizobium sp.]